MKSGAILGLIDAGDASLAERMCACLSHRGAFHEIGAPAPGVFIGCPVDGCESAFETHSAVSCGEISNRAAVMTMLDIDQSRWIRLNDAELLLHLYLRGGPPALSQASGSYEVAICDAARRELVIASGRDSVRSLYLARVGPGWAFSPEIKAFLSVPTFRAEPSANSATGLKEVRRLWPGHYVRLGPAECSEGEIAADCFSARGSAPAGFPALRRAVVVAARRLCESADHVAVVLTPDCGALLALAAVCWVSADRLIDTYAVGFGEDDPFLKRAREIADRFRTRHREICVSAETVDSLLPELVWHIEEPLAPTRMLEYLLAAYQAASDGVQLVCGISAPAPAPAPSGWTSGLRRSRRSSESTEGEAGLIVPSRRELAALEQIHARAGLVFAPLFYDADIRICCEQLQFERRAHRRTWWRAMCELSAGLVPPELYRETLSIGPARYVLRERRQEMHQLWSKAFLGQEAQSIEAASHRSLNASIAVRGAV